MAQRVQDSCHDIKSSLDGTPLRYRVLGSGKKVFWLANGVGTDFFMWFPVLQAMLAQDPNLFNKCTLVISNYRGLFAELEQADPVKISIEHCITDILDVLTAMQISALDGLIGWSTGAQIGYNLSILHPHRVRRLFLLCPSAGHTLHYSLQPCIPWPRPLRLAMSSAMTSIIAQLKVALYTEVFDVLKAFVFSPAFPAACECLALFGGFPPIQPVYFGEYTRDLFQTRHHIRTLLDLILAVDAEPLTGRVTAELAAGSVIVSGQTDFITGAYLSDYIEEKMPGCRRVRFSMGSHFVLIEWPELLGKEIAMFVNA